MSETVSSTVRTGGSPHRRNRRNPLRLRHVAVLLLVSALTVTGIALVPDADAATNPFERGPAPSPSSIAAAQGPFAVTRTTVSRSSVAGFGGGDLYVPTDTGAGTFGAVAMAPGFTASRSSLAWLAPRIASQGFVVLNIDTTTTSDQPASRGTQLLAALTFLTTRSAARTRVDADRLAVMGHSMGGGGTLEAARSDPSLKAAIPLTPWDLNKNFSGVRVPTLIIGAQSDTIAAPRSHSIPFFSSMTANSDKAYLELARASHFAPNTPNTTIASMSVAWLKTFVDDDARYRQFLCPGPRVGTTVSQYRDSCG